MCFERINHQKMETNKQDMEKYVKDPRIPCKYGSKCYQKNQLHNDKYKHPPKRRTVCPFIFKFLHSVIPNDCRMYKIQQDQRRKQK